MGDAINRILASVDKKRRQEAEDAQFREIVSGINRIQNMPTPTQDTGVREVEGGFQTPAQLGNVGGATQQEKFDLMKNLTNKYGLSQATDPKSRQAVLSGLLGQAKPKEQKDIDTFQFDDDLYTRTPTGIKLLKEGEDKPKKVSTKAPRVTDREVGEGGYIYDIMSDGTRKNTFRFPDEKKISKAEVKLREAEDNLSKLEAMEFIEEDVVTEKGGFFSDDVTEKQRFYGGEQLSESEYRQKLSDAKTDVELTKKRVNPKREQPKKTTKYFNETELSEFKTLKKQGVSVEDIIKHVENTGQALSFDEAEELRKLYKGISE